MQTSIPETYDEERVDAALDLLRLFSKARRFVTYARTMRRRGTDPQRVLAEMRCRVSETIVDDCLLFDEPTVFALFGFASTWCGAAYESDPEKMAAADTEFERSHQRVVTLLGGQVGVEAVDAAQVALSPRP